MAKAKALGAGCVALAALVGGLYHWKHPDPPGASPTATAAIAAQPARPSPGHSLAEAPGIEGSWILINKSDGKSETAIFTIWKQPDGGYASVVSSDHPDVNRISADSVSVHGDDLEMEFKEIGAKFKGHLNNPGEIAGQITTRLNEIVTGTWHRPVEDGPVAAPGTPQPTIQDLQKCVGVYALNPNVRLTVSLDGETLVSTGMDRKPTRLIPVSPTEFRQGPDPTSIVFVMGSTVNADRILLRKYIAGKSYDRAMRRVEPRAGE